MKAVCASVLMLAAAFAPRARAAETGDPLTPLYPFGIFPGLLNNAKVKAELKITSTQEAEIGKNLKKHRGGFVKLDPTKKFNVAEVDKANFDAMMDLLSKTLDQEQMRRLKQLIVQNRGIAIFEYKEIRAALDMTADDAKKLTLIHTKMMNDLATQVGAKKLTKDEAQVLRTAYSKGIPEKVRTAMTEAQQKKLEELIGKQFVP